MTSQIGRFISPDPFLTNWRNVSPARAVSIYHVMQAGSVGTYSYVDNSPTMRTDPSGLYAGIAPPPACVAPGPGILIGAALVGYAAGQKLACAISPECNDVSHDEEICRKYCDKYYDDAVKDCINRFPSQPRERDICKGFALDELWNCYEDCEMLYKKR